MGDPLQVPLSLPVGDRGRPTLRVLMPATRAGCANVPRPCPHLECRQNILGEIARHPDFDAAVAAFEAREEAGCTESCALDVAEQGPHTAKEIATIMGISKQRVLQIADEAGHYARRFSAKEQSETRSLLQTAEVLRGR